MFSQKYHKIGKPKKELTETKKCRRNLIQTQKQVLKPNHMDIEVDWFSLLRNMQTISQSSHGNEHSSSELQRLGSQTMGTGSQALRPVLTFCFLCISLFPLDSSLFSSTFCELFSLAQKFSDKEIFCYVLFLCLRQRVPYTLFKAFCSCCKNSAVESHMEFSSCTNYSYCRDTLDCQCIYNNNKWP